MSLQVDFKPVISHPQAQLALEKVLATYDEPNETTGVFDQIQAMEAEILRGEITEPEYLAYNFSEFDDFDPADVPQEDPWWS